MGVRNILESYKDGMVQIFDLTVLAFGYDSRWGKEYWNRKFMEGPERNNAGTIAGYMTAGLLNLTIAAPIAYRIADTVFAKSS